MPEGTEPTPPTTGGARERRTDWRLLVLLVLPLRGWLLHNTEVTARDSIGYIRYALAFEKKPWHEVWKDNDQHPGYPLAVWAVSVPVRGVMGAESPRAMQLSAQLVSFAAALLLLLPTYHLGRLLLGRAAGFGGSLLFQYWPVSAHHLSDGISEPLFLLLVVSALWQAVAAVESRRPGRFALCGLLTGLAYLTRPEGALVLPAAALVLCATQLRSATRAPWRRALACGGSLVLCVVLVGSVYVAATGRITNKLSILEMYHRVVGRVADGTAPPDARLAVAGKAPIPGVILAATYPPTDSKTARLALSTRALLMEVNQGFHYVGTVPALLGLWWCFGRLRRQPGFRVVALYASLHAAVLLALAVVVCYVSDRHTMVLVLFGSYLAAAALCELPGRLLAWWMRSPAVEWRRPAAAWAAVLVVSVVAVCLPRTIQRLHGNRAGNLVTGLWLAGKLTEGDTVVDDHAWSHFYAGMLFRETPAPPPPGAQCYVVLTNGKSYDGRPGSPRVDDYTDAALKGRGKLVYQWPEQSPAEKARITVRVLPRPLPK